MKVSIVIPCYNLGDYITEAIDSALRQTHEEIEVIVVNDGSTDKYTNDLLGSFRQDKVKIITTKNQGLPHARNNGIKIAKGDYIICLDADDTLESNYVEECLACFQLDKDNKLGFVTTWVHTFGEKDEIWKTLDYDPIALMAQTSNGVSVASMFRKELWIRVGGFPGNLSKGGYEDLSFWISLIALGYKWECVHKPLFRYRIRKGSMIVNAKQRHDELYKKVIENNLDYYTKNTVNLVTHFSSKYNEIADKYNELLNDYSNLKVKNKNSSFRKFLKKLK